MGMVVRNPSSSYYLSFSFTHMHAHTHIHTHRQPSLMLCWILKAQIFNSLRVKPGLGIEDRVIIEESHTDLAVSYGHELAFGL